MSILLKFRNIFRSIQKMFYQMTGLKKRVQTGLACCKLKRRINSAGEIYTDTRPIHLNLSSLYRQCSNLCTSEILLKVTQKSIKSIIHTLLLKISRYVHDLSHPCILTQIATSLTTC